MFEEIKAVLFDLDGTIYLGNQLIPGAKEVVDKFRSQGKNIFFMTNNSTKSRKQIYEKLVGMGLQCNLNEIYTSGYAAALYAKRQGYSQVYISGTDGLKSEFTASGINVCDSADVMVIGYDMSFDYEKMTEALRVGLLAKIIIACNKERHYPVEGGKRLPGCGAMVGAIEGSLGRKVDYVVGKPNPLLLDIICRHNGLESKELLVIGDTYESDILMSIEYGSQCVYIGEQNEDIMKVSDIKQLLCWL